MVLMEVFNSSVAMAHLSGTPIVITLLEACRIKYCVHLIKVEFLENYCRPFNKYVPHWIPVLVPQLFLIQNRTYNFWDLEPNVLILASNIKLMHTIYISMI
jgi:hypothetical protein